MGSVLGAVCCIKECDLPVLAVGLCNKHWRRNKRYGSPALAERTSGFFKGMTTPERFFAQVVENKDACWEWPGGKDQDGYGVFRGEVLGVPYTRAHRYSWAFHNQQVIPEGGIICHSCDNPQCANPKHLRLGTHEDNQRERRSKGRHGSNRTPAAKLTPDMVREIRSADGRQSDIAAKFGITQTTVSDIRRRKSWAHID